MSTILYGGHAVPRVIQLPADDSWPHGIHVTIAPVSRHLAIWATLEPWAEIIKAEFREKTGYPVAFNFRKLAAADTAARVRAYETPVAAGVDKEEAAGVSGMTL